MNTPLRSEQTPTLWAVMQIHHPSGCVGRGPSARISLSQASRLRAGDLSEEDLFGTEAAPGSMRRTLSNFLPSICLNPEAKIVFLIQDSNGVKVDFAKKDAQVGVRAELEALFKGTLP